MTLPDRDIATGWIGKTVVDPEGAELGRCSALFADDATQLPEWLVVVRQDDKTAFIPVIDAAEDADRVRVAFTRDAVTSAPLVTQAGHISEEEEATLYAHYGVPYSRSASESGLPAAESPATESPTPVGSSPDMVAAAPSAESVVDAAPAYVPDMPSPVAPVPPMVTPSVGRGSAQLGTMPSNVPSRRQPPVALIAGVAGVAALIGALFGLRRFRQRRQPPPPSPAERLAAQSRTRAAAASRSLAAQRGQLSAWAVPRLQASSDAASRSARARSAAAANAAAVAGPRIADSSRTAARKAGEAARKAADGARKVGDAAATTATQGTAAAEAAADAARKARESAASRAATIAAGASAAMQSGRSSASDVKAALRSVPVAVSEGGERLQETGRRIVGTITATLALGVGYLLGARAGRQRYEQLKGAAVALQQRPEVRQATSRIAALASTKFESTNARPGVQRARNLTTRYYRPNRYAAGPTDIFPALDPDFDPPVQDI